MHEQTCEGKSLEGLQPDLEVGRLFSVTTLGDDIFGRPAEDCYCSGLGSFLMNAR